MTKLTPKQLQAVILIAEGKTNKQVADTLNIVPHTVGIWAKYPVFKAEVNKLRMDALEAARTALNHSSTLAVDVLIDVLQTSKNGETKRKAALDILRLNGFEPDQHRAYAWGIGKTKAEGLKEESTSISQLISEMVY